MTFDVLHAPAPDPLAASDDTVPLRLDFPSPCRCCHSPPPDDTRRAALDPTTNGSDKDAGYTSEDVPDWIPQCPVWDDESSDNSSCYPPNSKNPNRLPGPDSNSDIDTDADTDPAVNADQETPIYPFNAAIRTLFSIDDTIDAADLPYFATPPPVLPPLMPFLTPPFTLNQAIGMTKPALTVIFTLIS